MPLKTSAVAGLAALLLLILTPVPAALGHGKEHHAPAAQAAAMPVPGPQEEGAPPAFPVEIGGPFELVDQFGNPRSSGDFGGAYALIFFGYARCESICPVALRTMLEASDRLVAAGHRIQPILITIDPEGEPPAVLKAAVEAISPRLLGLTGSRAQIDAVQKAFHVGSERVGTNIKGNEVFAHGSYIYFMAPDGHFLTLLPPILDGAAMAEKLRAYL